MPPDVILYGGTGQAKVVRPIIEYHGGRVVAVFDDTPGLKSPFPDVPIYQGWNALLHWLESRDRKRIGFSITIGNPHGRVRLRLHEALCKEGLTPVSAIHPSAWISKSAEIGAGAQILAGAIILDEAKLGRQVIVNTKASVDHECVLEDGTELAPGATLCGIITLKIGAWVCAGATVLPRITIGQDAIVGAGAVVTRDVAERSTVIGVPAREMKRED